MQKWYTRTNLFEVIAQRGWSKAYVARKLGYDVSYLYKMANGQRVITPAFVDRACALFQLPASALFFEPKQTPFRDHSARIEDREPVTV